MNETGEQKAPRKKMKKWKKVLLIIIAVPLALFIALMAWAAYDESKMTPEEKAARDVSRAVVQSERESSIAASQSEAAVKESESQALAFAQAEADRARAEADKAQAEAERAKAEAEAAARTTTAIPTTTAPIIAANAAPATTIPATTTTTKPTTTTKAMTTTKTTTTTAPPRNISYEQLARNPYSYIGETVTFSGRVSTSGTDYDGKIYYSLDINGDHWSDIYIYSTDRNNRVLEGDWVTVTGTFLGLDEVFDKPSINEISRSIR